jgi:hypothetical protein
MDAIVLEMFSPGKNAVSLKVLIIVLFALLASILVSLGMGVYSIHLVVLLFIAAALLASVYL